MSVAEQITDRLQGFSEALEHGTALLNLLPLESAKTLLEKLDEFRNPVKSLAQYIREDAPLREYILRAIKTGPCTLEQLTSRVLDLGYKTNSRSFEAIVRQQIYKMAAAKQIRNRNGIIS